LLLRFVGLHARRVAFDTRSRKPVYRSAADREIALAWSRQSSATFSVS
jgi:hypothetical protein